MMNSAFTPVDVYNFLTAACGLVITVWAVVGIVAKILEIRRKPDKEQNAKIQEHEKWLERHDRKFEEYDRFFQKDKERLDSIDSSNRVTQKALLALLSHAINGNDIESLKEARDSLETYLTNK